MSIASVPTMSSQIDVLFLSKEVYFIAVYFISRLSDLVSLCLQDCMEQWTYPDGIGVSWQAV